MILFAYVYALIRRTQKHCIRLSISQIKFVFILLLIITYLAPNNTLSSILYISPFTPFLFLSIFYLSSRTNHLYSHYFFSPPSRKQYISRFFVSSLPLQLKNPISSPCTPRQFLPLLYSFISITFSLYLGFFLPPILFRTGRGRGGGKGVQG